jgi:hypothetical protein
LPRDLPPPWAAEVVEGSGTGSGATDCAAGVVDADLVDVRAGAEAEAGAESGAESGAEAVAEAGVEAEAEAEAGARAGAGDGEEALAAPAPFLWDCFFFEAGARA